MAAPIAPIVPEEISGRRVLKGGLIVAVGLGVAQFSGFIRQVVIGYLLGTGREADALSAAMAPVELWWTVAFLTIVYGFVPRFTPAAPGGEWAFREVLRPIAGLAAASSIAMVLLAEPLVRLFAPGLEAETVTAATAMLRILGLAPLAVGCSFVYSALLLSRRRFAFPTLHHAAVSLATVAGALLLFDRLGAYGFPAGYTLGAFGHLAAAHFYTSAIRGEQRRALAQTATAPGRRAGLVEIFSGPGPILAQSLALECSTAVSRAFASTFGPGMTAAFDYGFKLFRVPLALLVVPLSQSLLPEISDRQSAADQRPAIRAMMRAAGLTAGVGLAVMVALMALREPVVRLLFERGEFGAASTEAVSAILLGYLPVMIGRGLVDLLSRTLFGMRRFRVPLAATVGALALNAVICAALSPAHPVLIGLGASVGFLVAAIVILSHVAVLKRNV